MRYYILMFILTINLLTGCNMKEEAVAFKHVPNITGVWEAENSPLNGAPLIEDKSIYNSDDDKEIIPIYLTVQKDNDKNHENRFSFDALNLYTGEGKEPHCEIIMQDSLGEFGPKSNLFGLGETMANGRLETRGNIQSIRQRSYQIKLYERAGLWRGMSTLNFNKELGDLSRIKNKLAFDAIEQVNHIAGLRTMFVNLYIKDLSKDNPDKEFKDFGLYTFMEQPNKAYLRSRGFQENGSLYKAQNFNFERNADRIKNVDDPLYSKEEFSKVLSIREGKEHSKLISMLEVLQNRDIDTEDIINKYFNRDNLLTYSAINILYGNFTAAYDNYMIYSPQNSMTWYLIPYDMKDIFEEGIGAKKNTPPNDAYGISMLLNNVLFERFYENPENIEALNNKIDELYKTIGPDFIKKQTEKYKNSVLMTMYSMPELSYLPKAAEYVEPYMDSFSVLVSENRRRFKESLELPYPPYVYDYKNENGTLKIYWRSHGEANYNLMLATDINFKNIIASKEQINDKETQLDSINPGTYFLRISATGQDGKSQNCSNVYTDDYGDRHYGVVKVVVK